MPPTMSAFRLRFSQDRKHSVIAKPQATADTVTAREHLLSGIRQTGRASFGQNAPVGEARFHVGDGFGGEAVPLPADVSFP